MGGMTDWKHDGVRVIPAGSLDTNTAQTPGMNRAAAINFARVGAQKLWAGTVTIHAHAKTGAHHHGHLESVIYVVKGRARMRWGDQLQFIAEAGPGDFIYVPPYVPHQEINASETEPLECVLVRSDNEAVAINIDIDAGREARRGLLGRSDPSASAQALTRQRLGAILARTRPAIRDRPIGRQQHRVSSQRSGNDDAIERIAVQVLSSDARHGDLGG